mmetsp:Transcript_33334/g.38809  ORF Transcript_33334/g.38809 Transcript_33334/m.38809 type:complete len:194 (+) Transcript_33334:92-673(+)
MGAVLSCIDVNTMWRKQQERKNQEEATTVIESPLNDEQIQDCKDAFSTFKDNDGFVDIEHLGTMIRAVGEKEVTDEEIEKVTEELQPSETKIDFTTFLQLVTPSILEKNETHSDRNLKQLFKEFDDDGDGYISAGELRKSLQKLGDNFAEVADELTDDDVEEIMMEADLDGDGRISFSEFAEMIPRLNEIMDG